VLGKPVITFAESRERAHLEMLGDQALLYHNSGQVAQILETFEPHTTRGTNFETFSDPKVVMGMFRDRFFCGIS